MRAKRNSAKQTQIPANLLVLRAKHAIRLTKAAAREKETTFPVPTGRQWEYHEDGWERSFRWPAWTKELGVSI